MISEEARKDVDAWVDMELSTLLDDEMSEEAKDHIRSKIENI